MPAPLRLRLDQGTREAVAERYEQACTPIERTNAQVVLLADEGRTVTEIAWLVRRGRDQVRKILHRFRSEGLAGSTCIGWATSANDPPGVSNANRPNRPGG